METSTRCIVFVGVVGIALLATSCRFATKAPPGIDFPRKTVERAPTFLNPYPVRIDGRFAADRTLHDVSWGLGLGIAYRVAWRLEILGSPPIVARSTCEGLPDGDLYIHGKRLDAPALACTPQRGGPWLALERGCRRGRVGYRESELVLDATEGEYGVWEGHYLLRRDERVVAAIEIFTTPGSQGVWERDGLSVDDQAAVAFTANALEWVAEPQVRGRICR